MSERLVMCGGCHSQGAHRRWCRNRGGLAASIYGPMAERLESMGDTVGPNNMELSNRLWALSADMRRWAESLRTTADPDPQAPAPDEEKA